VIIIGRYTAWIGDFFEVESGRAYNTDIELHAAKAFERFPDAFEVPNVEPKRGPGRPRKEDTGV
jgi:hypothetical protein